LSILCKLFLDPKQVSFEEVPALESVEKGKPLYTKGVLGALKSGKHLYYNGGLRLNDIAGISNWLHVHLPNTSQAHPDDFQLPEAHARTLLLAHRHRGEFVTDSSADASSMGRDILLQAWQRLKDYTGLTVDGKIPKKSADVNYEAIAILDKIMFDKSVEAGQAGNQQWGLDSGPNEDLWDPYLDDPYHHNSREEYKGSESEWQVSYQLSVIKSNSAQNQLACSLGLIMIMRLNRR
jgi:hypothetical protein